VIEEVMWRIYCVEIQQKRVEINKRRRVKYRQRKLQRRGGLIKDDTQAKHIYKKVLQSR